MQILNVRLELNLVTKNDVVQNRFWDAQSMEDQRVDVRALHAQRWYRAVTFASCNARIQRLHRDVLCLLRRLHASGYYK